jgi:uncharacterized heparinase superfamily protein
VHEILDGQITFHGVTRLLHPAPWHDDTVPHLWRYQLHDFEYAQDLLAHERDHGDGRAAEAFLRLAHEWIDANPRPAGDGWHPYTVSMRLCAWARAIAGFPGPVLARGRARLAASILEQYAWLLGNLERDVLGNHLLENVRALAVAGLLVDGPLGERGRRRARGLLLEQLPRQVLPDGGHHERSPMYHAIVLGAIRETVDALRAAHVPVGPEPDRVVRRMEAFASAMLGADGEPLPFGDSTGGEAPRVAAPSGDRARRRTFPDTGYSVLRSPDGRDRVVLDHGDACPDELPAHAHADALSFVMERDGLPLLVDPGVGEYAEGPWRAYNRSTRAHGTIEIDGEDQTEVWGSFRAARRAYGLPLRSGEAGGDVWVEGGHDGYRRLPCRAVHRRRITSRAGGGWTVDDRVRSAGPCRVRSYLHFAPDLEVRLSGRVARVLRGAEVVASVRARGISGATVVKGEVRPIQGWVFPRFGEKRPAPVLVLEGRCEGDAGYRMEIE